VELELRGKMEEGLDKARYGRKPAADEILS
jgi:hypothetical protein